MRSLAWLVPAVASLSLLGACDDGGSGGGGSGTGGAAGASSGGTTSGGSAGSTGGSAGSSSGGSSGAGTGGSAGAGSCSVLSWNGCPALVQCMHTNCGDEIEACYGASYQSDDATGSLCESLWACSKNDCACGEDSCLITTCFGGATTDCQNCIPPISNCLTANCQAIADNCP